MMEEVINEMIRRIQAKEALERSDVESVWPRETADKRRQETHGCGISRADSCSGKSCHTDMCDESGQNEKKEAVI